MPGTKHGSPLPPEPALPAEPALPPMLPPWPVPDEPALPAHPAPPPEELVVVTVLVPDQPALPAMPDPPKPVDVELEPLVQPLVCPVVVGPVVVGPVVELPPPAPDPGSPVWTEPPHASITRMPGGVESKRMLVMSRESRSEVMADGSFEQAPCPHCRGALARFAAARNLTAMTGLPEVAQPARGDTFFHNARFGQFA
jgi:hypothetical protein